MYVCVRECSEMAAFAPEWPASTASLRKLDLVVRKYQPEPRDIQYKTDQAPLRFSALDSGQTYSSSRKLP